MVVGSIPASNHGGRAHILYLWWYASPGAAADQPGVQDWYIPLPPSIPSCRGVGSTESTNFRSKVKFELTKCSYVLRLSSCNSILNSPHPPASLAAALEIEQSKLLKDLERRHASRAVYYLIQYDRIGALVLLIKSFFSGASPR
jgi:hypothetical protein